VASAESELVRAPTRDLPPGSPPGAKRDSTGLRVPALHPGRAPAVRHPRARGQFRFSETPRRITVRGVPAERSWCSRVSRCSEVGPVRAAVSHACVRWRDGAGQRPPLSEPTRRAAGKRAQRFRASTAVPVIRVRRMTTGGACRLADSAGTSPIVDAVRVRVRAEGAFPLGKRRLQAGTVRPPRLEAWPTWRGRGRRTSHGSPVGASAHHLGGKTRLPSC
jgi:hypothetical protein